MLTHKQHNHTHLRTQAQSACQLTVKVTISFNTHTDTHTHRRIVCPFVFCFCFRFRFCYPDKWKLNTHPQYTPIPPHILFPFCLIIGILTNTSKYSDTHTHTYRKPFAILTVCLISFSFFFGCSNVCSVAVIIFAVRCLWSSPISVCPFYFSFTLYCSFVRSLGKKR